MGTQNKHKFEWRKKEGGKDGRKEGRKEKGREGKRERGREREPCVSPDSCLDSEKWDTASQGMGKVHAKEAEAEHKL